MNRKTCIAIVLMAMVVSAYGGWGSFKNALKKVGKTALKAATSPEGQAIIKGALTAGDEEIQALKDIRAQDEATYNLIADMIVEEADIGPVLSPRLRHHLDQHTKSGHDERELLDMLRGE